MSAIVKAYDTEKDNFYITVYRDNGEPQLIGTYPDNEMAEAAYRGYLKAYRGE